MINTKNSIEMKFCNLDYLKSISPDNPKFMKEMIQLFLKKVPQSIEEMNKFLIAADWHNLGEHAHKIKSNIQTMGIKKEILDAAKQIEDNCKYQKHLDLMPSLLLEIETEFNEVYKELEKELSRFSEIMKS